MSITDWKPALIVCSYNRPSLLRRCLDSLLSADLSYLKMLILIDDFSDNEESKEILRNFRLPGVDTYIICKETRLGIKDSLTKGFDLAFNRCDLAINLDADSVISKDFLTRLLWLKFEFRDNIVCGFNTTVKNRNPIIEEYETFYKKKYASGINMVLNREQYEKYVLPALLMPIGNWDFEASKLHEADGKSVIVPKPSLLQHTGVSESTMGHISESEPPDVATDFLPDFTIDDVRNAVNVLNNNDRPDWNIRIDRCAKNNGKLNLTEITLICADGFDLERVIHAANIACRGIEFGAVKILSHLPSDDPRVIKIRPLISSRDYSQFVLKEIVNYVDTDYMLIFQHDGFPIRPEAWSEDFISYDMVGATWKFRPEKRTANGGFSLRSRKMMEAIRDDEAIILQNDHIIRNYAEDHVLFYIYRDYLEQHHKIKIAPEGVCDRFSIEAWGVADNKYKGSFGFHGFNCDFNDADLPYIPYKLPNRQIL